jgi:hypothetical protein
MINKNIPRRDFLKYIFSSSAVLGCNFLGCSNPMSYEDHQNTNWKKDSAEVERVHQLIEKVSLDLKTLDDVWELQRQFVYIPEKREWDSTIETIFHYGLGGECEEAALLGRWSLEQIGIQSRFLRLYAEEHKSITHVTTMSMDNHVFITNQYVCTIEGPNWQEAVFTFGLLDTKYDMIRDEGSGEKYLRKDYCKI